ncbi:MAG TPA: VWA domain-containing protein [Bryobacteraceae bacterium]
MLDEGRERKIAVDTIDTGVAPIALVMAVQSSGISGPVLEKVRRIGSMIQPLVTGERGYAALVSFAERIDWLQDCTHDADAFGRALDRLRPGEHKQAVMLDAVVAAIGRLSKQENARRVLLLISESRDRGSETDLQTAAMKAESAGVAIYAATYSAMRTAFTSKSPVSEPGRVEKPRTPADIYGTPTGAPPSKYNPKTIPVEQRVDIRAGLAEILRLHKENDTQALAATTGAITFPFTRQKRLETAIQKFGGELHAQYVLSFAPEAPAPGYHKLEVRIVRPGSYQIRARPGYWPDEEPR